MSGHSHWASIRHKKEDVDAKKGKVFSKIARYIMIATKQGGADPSMNLKLQYAIEEARSVNMPKENIERAIKKGSGEQGSTAFENVIYEGYGPGGVAIMVDAITDNKNRTSHEIRRIFENNGANLGSANCVSWMFERKGLITIGGSDATEDTLLADALECGAENVELAGDVYEITSSVVDFENVKKKLSAKYKLKSAEITMVPKSYVSVDETAGKKLLEFMNAIEDHEDVQKVYSNFELPPSLAQIT
jgi:YebC/PmpR family DNA-binding regulatory protein